MPDNDADTISTDIANAATAPASATIDGNSVVARSIDEKIKARNDAASQSATARPQFGLRFTKLLPPPAG